MKAYGFSRSDKQGCRYGCCTTHKGKMNKYKHRVDSAKKKTARQHANKTVDKACEQEVE